MAMALEKKNNKIWYQGSNFHRQEVMKLKIGASTLRHFCSNFAGTSSIALDLSDDPKQLILISINLLVVYRELVFYER